MAASLSYYLLETPLAAVRKRVPYLSNPRLLHDVIGLPAVPTLQSRQDAPARVFEIQPDISNDVIRLLNAVGSEPRIQPGTQEVKGESLRS